jgi:hypothetical protein
MDGPIRNYNYSTILTNYKKDLVNKGRNVIRSLLTNVVLGPRSLDADHTAGDDTIWVVEVDEHQAEITEDPPYWHANMEEEET